MDVSVHIERLVLEGIDLPRGQWPLLQAAVEAELARLLAAAGVGPGWMAGGAVPHVAGGDIQLMGEGDPTRLGQQIGQAVYGGIRK